MRNLYIINTGLKPLAFIGRIPAKTIVLKPSIFNGKITYKNNGFKIIVLIWKIHIKTMVLKQFILYGKHKTLVLKQLFL